MKCAFAEIDISPPAGSRKIGWIKLIIGEKILDPLFGRAAIFENGSERAAFIQLDTLSVREDLVRQIREAIEKAHGFPGQKIMISATHNHAGPGVSDVGEVMHDDAYCDMLVGKLVILFGQAIENMQEAEIGFGRALNFNLAKNRRVVMRNGTVKTHGTFADPDALFIEGPIDPEVNVLAVRAGGKLLGAMVNYSCHPTHLGGDPVFTAGWPGVMARLMKQRGCPVPMFLNGAEGQTHHDSPVTGSTGMEECGKMLADSFSEALQNIQWRSDAKIRVASRTIRLPFRKITEDEINGTVFGAQRFIDPGIYERLIPPLVEKLKRLGSQPIELQIIGFDEYVFVAIPAELFVELGLEIKQRVNPRRAIVVGLANGIIGYLPTLDAFKRGGYETTFLDNKKMAYEAGNLLVDGAVQLICDQ
ncbi:MAG TPA: hypothetical protein VG722_00990 [Tepidisphaeraceae bacterium]|nr:hypothetical protein [Tepidisphaeraceae bacterium]